MPASLASESNLKKTCIARRPPTEGQPADWENSSSAQQDFVQDTWDELVAAVDGSMDSKKEIVDTSVVVGNGREAQLCISASVRGPPCHPFHPKAAFLHRVLGQVPSDAPILAFIGCRMLPVSILAKWGQEDLWPDPEEIKHFEIIGPCLSLLRGRHAVTRLVKMKCRSCLLISPGAFEVWGGERALRTVWSKKGCTPTRNRSCLLINTRADALEEVCRTGQNGPLLARPADI